MGQDEHFKRRHSGWAHALNLLAWGLISTAFLGCTGFQDRYVEQHAIKNLTVVFLDEQSLHERWTQVSGRDPIRFTSLMSDTSPIVKTLRGFYDYGSNTIYCPKWDFEVCGHELHHAVLGQFHQAD